MTQVAVHLEQGQAFFGVEVVEIALFGHPKPGTHEYAQMVDCVHPGHDLVFVESLRVECLDHRVERRQMAVPEVVADQLGVFVGSLFMFRIRVWEESPRVWVVMLNQFAHLWHECFEEGSIVQRQRDAERAVTVATKGESHGYRFLLMSVVLAERGP